MHLQAASIIDFVEAAKAPFVSKDVGVIQARCFVAASTTAPVPSSGSTLALRHQRATNENVFGLLGDSAHFSAIESHEVSAQITSYPYVTRFGAAVQ